jgi:hypothetical protein
VPPARAQLLPPAFQITRSAQVGQQQLAHVGLTPDAGPAQQRLQILDPVAPPEQQRAGLFQVDQLGGKTRAVGLEENMLGVETAVHLPGTVQLPRQLAAGAQDGLTSRCGGSTPALQPVFEVAPAVQGAGQQNGAALAGHAALGEKGRLQGGNAQPTIDLDIAKFAGKGRLAPRVQQAAGQVVALALEVEGRPAQLQTIHAAPAAAFGIGFVDRLQLQGP